MKLQDTIHIKESWSFPGDKQQALQEITRFPERFKALVDHTPPKKLTDYKLVCFDKYAAYPSIAKLRTPWIILFDPQVNGKKYYLALAEDVVNGRKGTTQELPIPADGNFDHLKPGNVWKPI